MSHKIVTIVLPLFSGLAAIKEIRGLEEFHDLPIISLTAKAMKGDREKCLEAGASDYITKPVDEKNLLALMYGWLKQDKVVETPVDVGTH